MTGESCPECSKSPSHILAEPHWLTSNLIECSFECPFCNAQWIETYTLTKRGIAILAVQVSYDAFGRFCIMRKVEHGMDCAWCGSERAKGGAFRYGYKPDGYGSRVQWQEKTFCCIECMRTYYF